MISKEISLNNNLFWEIKANHLQKLWTLNIKVNWAFGHCIGIWTLVSMNFIFILMGDNAITYKHFKLIFGISILNVNWAFGNCIGMGTLVSMNFISILWGDNGITY